MASTRTNLTVAFVAGLVAITSALGLTFWLVRNASVYGDIARYASTEADLAAGLILEAGAGEQAVVIGPDTASETLAITPRLGALLNAFPGYLVVVDRQGSSLFESSEVQNLGKADLLNVAWSAHTSARIMAPRGPLDGADTRPLGHLERRN